MGDKAIAKRNIKNKIKSAMKRIEKRYIIILIVALVVFIPYFSENFIAGDDYSCHISNIFTLTKKFGLFTANKVRPIMANGLGYGDGIFYPQLPYICTALIYKIVNFIGFGLISSIKFYEFMVLLFSGIFMYKYVNKVFKNKNIAVLASIIYITSPYFLRRYI